MNLTWLLQHNLTNPNDLEALKQAITTHHADYKEIQVIPFSNELSYEVNENEFPILYGSTTLMWNGYHHPKLQKGVFFDPETFTMENLLSQWGNRLLNHDGFFLTVDQLLHTQREDEHITYFVRPNEDTKLFSGTLSTIHELKEDLAPLLAYNPYIQPETRLFFATPKRIEKEWRHFIVNKKIVSSCRYAIDGEVSKNTEDVPKEMLRFVQECCDIYTPHAIFVVDVAQSEGRYSLLECNCFNGTGFYDHNIDAIVKHVNDYLRQFN